MWRSEAALAVLPPTGAAPGDRAPTVLIDAAEVRAVIPEAVEPGTLARAETRGHAARREAA